MLFLKVSIKCTWERWLSKAEHNFSTKDAQRFCIKISLVWDLMLYQVRSQDRFVSGKKNLPIRKTVIKHLKDRRVLFITTVVFPFKDYFEEEFTQLFQKTRKRIVVGEEKITFLVAFFLPLQNLFIFFLFLRLETWVSKHSNTVDLYLASYKQKYSRET